MTNQNSKLLKLSIILFIGFLLRLYNLTAVALWHDEAFSALLIRYPWGEMFRRIALDVHPPFYYIVLRGWDYLFGDSLFSLRFFSLVFGMLTIWFFYLFIKKAFKNERLALVGALFLAINPFQIQYSQEARMYTLGAFLLVLACWFLARALQNNQWRDWLGHGVAAGLALQTHYFLIFSVFALAVFVFFWPANWRVFKKESFKKAIGAYLAGAVVFLPWLSVFFSQFNQVQENYWIPKMTALSVSATFWKMFSGWQGNVLPLFVWLQAAAFLLILAFILIKKNWPAQAKWLTAISFLLPFLLAVAVSFKRSLYLDRYFIFAGMFYLLLLAMFLVTIFKKKAVFAAVIAILAAVNLFFYFDNWQKIDPSLKPGMAGAAAYLNEATQANDKIYIGSSFVYFTFKYYNHTGIYPLLYTPGISGVKQLPHFSGTALLNDEDLLNSFESGAEKSDRVWLLWTTGFGAQKPAVPANWQEIEEKGFEDAFNYRGWIVATLYQVW